MNERLVLFFPPYKKSQFYQLMGAFFAERVYQQQFPYLVNDENCYWYVILDDEKRVTAFSYYEKGANKVELGEFYGKDPTAQFKKFLLRKMLVDISRNYPEAEILASSNQPSERQ